ncbi:hypothetical protein JMA43_12700 [Joostella sp. CR20]
METEVKETTENFDWLLGKWQRVNEKEGRQTFEKWTKISNSKYTGIGFTMQDGDTVKREKIHLVEIDKQWSLAVEVLEEPQLTIFKMTNYTSTTFTCTNDSIEFPNKIKYWKEGDRLKAMVSNAEIEISFEFKKL